MTRPEVLAAGRAVTKAPETNIVRMIAGNICLGVFFIHSSLIWLLESIICASFAPSELGQYFHCTQGWRPGLHSGAASRLSGSSQSFWCMTASVQTPLLTGIGHEEDYEQKQQREMVEFGTEVVPH